MNEYTFYKSVAYNNNMLQTNDTQYYRTFNTCT